MFREGDIATIKNEDKYNLWESEKNSKWIVECVMDECCTVKNIKDIVSYGGININIRKEDLYKVSSIAEIARRY